MWQPFGFKKRSDCGRAEAGRFSLAQPNHGFFWKREPPKSEPGFPTLWTIPGGEVAVGVLALAWSSEVKSSPVQF